MWTFFFIIAGTLLIAILLAKWLDDPLKKSNAALYYCFICNMQMDVTYEVTESPFVCKACAKQIESNLSNTQKKARIKGSDKWP
jgi:hypothetical protein